MPDKILIEGRVVIAASAPPMDGAAVHVRLEDVSAVDSASTLLAQTVVHAVRHRGSTKTVVPFVMRGSIAIDPNADYAVRIWVDRDDDGSPGDGDLHSDRRYPVLTRGFGRTVDIAVGSSAGASNGTAPR